MIIRNSNGKIEIIDKYDFIDDNKYYKYILDIMKKYKNTEKSKLIEKDHKKNLLSKL